MNNRRVKCQNCGESFITGFYTLHIQQCIQRRVLIEKIGYQTYRKIVPFI